MSKEIILQDCHKAKVLNWDKVFVQNPTIIESAYEAMDIHAQNTAIEFAEWLSHNCYDKASAAAYYSWDIKENEWLISQDGMCVKTTEQLYELFLQSKTPTTHE